MDRFISNFTTRLDTKGRLSVPAPFRAVLARDGFEGLYVHPSLDWPTLDCGGHALLASLEALITPLPAFDPDRDAMGLTLLGESDVLKMDADGRISLPSALKAHAEIAGEATFVGVGHKFQIWEPARFRQRLADARRQALAWRQQAAARHGRPEAAE